MTHRQSELKNQFNLIHLLCVNAFVTFPYAVFSQVWYMTISIPDICPYLYFCLRVIMFVIPCNKID